VGAIVAETATADRVNKAEIAMDHRPVVTVIT
jgi:hypothetical protein